MDKCYQYLWYASLLSTQSKMFPLIATTGKVKQLSSTVHYLHALRSSVILHPQNFYLSNQCYQNKCAEPWTRNSTWGTMNWKPCHRICSATCPSLLSLFSVETAWRQWMETCLPICLVKCTTNLLYYCQSHTGGKVSNYWKGRLIHSNVHFLSSQA